MWTMQLLFLAAVAGLRLSSQTAAIRGAIRTSQPEAAPAAPGNAGPALPPPPVDTDVSVHVANVAPIPAASTVGMPATIDTAIYDDSDNARFIDASRSSFTLQYVHATASGTAASPLDPNEDRCLEVLDTETDFGGRALNFTPCTHMKAFPEPTPINKQFFFLPNGKIAVAGNHTNPLCIRERKCYGKTVYDAAGCELASISTFAVSKTMAGRLDELKKLGPPLHGVVGPGSLHGPFQLYTSCVGVPKKGGGCQKMVPNSGWTKDPTQYIGAVGYSDTAKTNWDISWMFEEDPISATRDFANSKGEKDNAAAQIIDTGEEAFQGDLGIQMLEDSACGTMVGSGGRGDSWWYFNRVAQGSIQPDPVTPVANTTNSTNTTL